MPKKEFLTDEQVETEIERLCASPAVKLAKREEQLKYRRRQRMYCLRSLEKRGKALMSEGMTEEKLFAIYGDEGDV